MSAAEDRARRAERAKVLAEARARLRAECDRAVELSERLIDLRATPDERGEAAVLLKQFALAVRYYADEPA